MWPLPGNINPVPDRYSMQNQNSGYRPQFPPSPYRQMQGITPARPVVCKIEDSPEPEVLITSVEPCLSQSVPAGPMNPADAEGLLKRCSGLNKKTKARCSAVIGKKAQQNTHPTYLPTCSAHRDQQTFAGWCQLKLPNGERCGRLFGWQPPYFELCQEHQGHPDTPSYFLKLPLELRHEIYRYLLPTNPIGSSTAALHTGADRCELDPFEGPYAHLIVNPMMSRPLYNYRVSPPSNTPPLADGAFPFPYVDLILVNRQMCQEVQDLFFSIATFTIDVRKDGTFMCGRRLLEPQRPDGTSHLGADDVDYMKQHFLKQFNWPAVKNYKVDILIENWSHSRATHGSQSWDEEVEIYDIRDYVSVVVSGILAKSKNLCKLSVRLCLAAFEWSEATTLANTKLIVGPFERLRNVRQPTLTGVYQGVPPHNQMLQLQQAKYQKAIQDWNLGQLCSVPTLPVHSKVLARGMKDFDAYAADWARWIRSTSSSPLTLTAPIKDMFTSFKDFYTKLLVHIPFLSHQYGRRAFLHRARVARELEDVESFRLLRNELIQYWYTHLENEEAKKKSMNERLSRMLDCDVYPDHDRRAGSSPKSRASSSQGSSSKTRNDSSSDSGSGSGSGTLQSPIELDTATMALEGIPMTANPRPALEVETERLNRNYQSRRQREAMYQQMQQMQRRQSHEMQRSHENQRFMQLQQQQNHACQMRAPLQTPVHTAPTGNTTSGFEEAVKEAGLHDNTLQHRHTRHSETPHHFDSPIFPSINPAPSNEYPGILPQKRTHDANDDAIAYHTPPQPPNELASILPGRASESLLPFPGSAYKRQRVDSGNVMSRVSSSSSSSGTVCEGEGEGGGVVQDSGIGGVEDRGYVGKGKGKMVEIEDEDEDEGVCTSVFPFVGGGG